MPQNNKHGERHFTCGQMVNAMKFPLTEEKNHDMNFALRNRKFALTLTMHPASYTVAYVLYAQSLLSFKVHVTLG